MQAIISFFRSNNDFGDSTIWRNIEIGGATIVFVVFLALELNAIFKGGAQGQDYYYHRQLTLEMAQHPFSPSPGRHLDPPLYYGVAAVVLRLFGLANWHGWTRAMGVVNVMFNLCALFFLYANARLMISNRFLRLGLLCFVAFLPAFAITSAVICTDALTPVWILVGLYFVGRAIYRDKGLGLAFIACTIAAALSILSKFTAICLVPAFVLSVVLFVWCRLISFRRAIISSVIFLVITGGIELLLLAQHGESLGSNFTAPHKRLPVRSVLFFRSGDVDLLAAPSHWRLALSPKSDPPSFSLKSRYSYPALVCLGTFTDILDFFQDKAGLKQEPTEPYLGGALKGKRSLFHQQMMEVALKGGFVWFIAILFSLPVFVMTALVKLFRYKSKTDLFYIVLFLVGAAWLGFIASLLPLVVGAYGAGYWLPRLITPSIVLFLLLFFAGLDRIRLPGSIASCIFGLAIAQSVIHIQFLWM